VQFLGNLPQPFVFGKGFFAKYKGGSTIPTLSDFSLVPLPTPNNPNSAQKIWGTRIPVPTGATVAMIRAEASMTPIMGGTSQIYYAFGQNNIALTSFTLNASQNGVDYTGALPSGPSPVVMPLVTPFLDMWVSGSGDLPCTPDSSALIAFS
jgi:hypothetical protein